MKRRLCNDLELGAFDDHVLIVARDGLLGANQQLLGGSAFAAMHLRLVLLGSAQEHFPGRVAIRRHIYITQASLLERGECRLARASAKCHQLFFRPIPVVRRLLFERRINFRDDRVVLVHRRVPHKVQIHASCSLRCVLAEILRADHRHLSLRLLVRAGQGRRIGHSLLYFHVGSW